MNTSTQRALPCAIFGHNYIKSKTNLDNTSELTCNHCKVVVKTDAKGNFIETTNPSKDVQSTLRKLYHLKLRSRQLSIS